MALIAVATLAGLAVLLLGVAQLVLPPLAQDRLRGELSAHGRVRSVRVSAFPALKLLFDRADSVSITMSELHTAVSRSGDLLARAHETARLDVLIDTASIGPLALHDVRLSARGDRLHGEASVSQAALQSALPPGLGVQPIASGDGRLLLRGSIGLFGIGVSADALLSAMDGKLVIEPVGVPFGGLARLTVYSDPRVAISGVGASDAPGGFVFSADGRLR